MKNKRASVKAKSSLFAPGPGHGTVVLNWSYPQRDFFGIYGQTYHEAGRALADRLIHSNGYSDMDALPILFLYRHAVELQLKGVVICGREIQQLREQQITATANPFKQHKLALWIPEIKQIFNEVGWSWQLDTKGVRTWAEMETLVQELETIDVESDAFRYPVTTQGAETLPMNFYVHIPTCCARLDALIDALDAAETGLSAILDTLQDMASDAG